jgi:hypothetical protein
MGVASVRHGERGLLIFLKSDFLRQHDVADSNQIARGRVRRFESYHPSHAVRSTRVLCPKNPMVGSVAAARLPPAAMPPPRRRAAR